jgi:hypothetical protein
VGAAEVAAAAEAAQKLRVEVGTTLASLKELSVRAAAYSDDDYMRYASGLRTSLEELADFTVRLRREVLPFVTGAAAAWAAAERARFGQPLGRAADAAAAAAHATALKALGPHPDLPLPPPPARPWRYPPRQYVLHKRKGLAGGWVAPLAMPGRERPLPAVRDQRDDLPPSDLAPLRGAGGGGGGRRGRGKPRGGSGGARRPGSHGDAPEFSGMFD